MMPSSASGLRTTSKSFQRGEESPRARYVRWEVPLKKGTYWSNGVLCTVFG